MVGNIDKLIELTAIRCPTTVIVGEVVSETSPTLTVVPPAFNDGTTDNETVDTAVRSPDAVSVVAAFSETMARTTRVALASIVDDTVKDMAPSRIAKELEVAVRVGLAKSDTLETAIRSALTEMVVVALSETLQILLTVASDVNVEVTDSETEVV